MIPPGTAGSVAAATAAFATACTLVGGTKAAPASGMFARDLAGRKPRALSKGTPARWEQQMDHCFVQRDSVCQNSGEYRIAKLPKCLSQTCFGLYNQITQPQFCMYVLVNDLSKHGAQSQ